jgi:transposase
VDDLRAVLRLATGHRAEPSAAIIDSRTLRSTPESGERAGYDGAKRKKGSKIHMAVDTLGHLLALHVTPASAEDRGEVELLARTVQAVTGDTVDLAWVDQGYTRQRAADAAARQGIALRVVKLSQAKRGFVLLPRRWVVERSFAWATRFRRLVKDYERYAQTLAGLPCHRFRLHHDETGRRNRRRFITASSSRDGHQAKGIQPSLPGRRSRNKPVGYDKRRYRRRSRIKIMFSHLKDWRRGATRYDHSPHCLLLRYHSRCHPHVWL